MEKFPKFIKKAAKIAAIASVGFMSMDSEAKAQNAENPKENKIEASHELVHQIFQEIEQNYEKFLENSEQDPYYFHGERNGYEMEYDLDANQDGVRDDHAKIKIEHTEGNSNFLLTKDKESIKNIAYNYVDDALVEAKADTYENFFTRYRVTILSLYGKNQHPITFRELNEEEKGMFLSAVKEFFRERQSAANIAQKNSENLKQFEEKKKKESLEELGQEKRVASLVHLYDSVRKINESADHKEVDPISGFTLVTSGNYKYQFGGRKFKISFTDQLGAENEIELKLGNEPFISTARKIVEKESRLSIQDLSTEEIDAIISSARAQIGE